MSVRLYDRKLVPTWIIPALKWARQHGWHGQVTSGWRSRAHQLFVAKKYARSKGLTLRQCYPHGVFASNHCGSRFPRGAVDVTDAAELNRVLHGMPSHIGHRPVWGGPVINDQVHFSASGH